MAKTTDSRRVVFSLFEKTKKEVIHLGLREIIRLARLKKARAHRGKVRWQGDLAKMRELETLDRERSPGIDATVLIDYFGGEDNRGTEILDQFLAGLDEGGPGI